MLRPTRLLALGGLIVVGFLYWKPLHTYSSTRNTLTHRQVQVARLERQRSALEKKIASLASETAFIRQARTLGLVKPGEQLFIVRGIPQWRKHK